MSVRQSHARTTVPAHRTRGSFTDITIDREYASGRRSETYLLGMIGGTVPGVQEDGSRVGPRTHQAVKWERDALIFKVVLGSPFPDQKKYLSLTFGAARERIERARGSGNQTGVPVFCV